MEAPSTAMEFFHTAKVQHTAGRLIHHLGYKPECLLVITYCQLTTTY